MSNVSSPTVGTLAITPPPSPPPSPPPPLSPPPLPSPSSTVTDLPSPSIAFVDLERDDDPCFSPTLPVAESGSPRKERDAPLDPLRPMPGMMFQSLGEAVHFVQEYERRRGYRWRKGESKKTQDGTSSSIRGPRLAQMITGSFQVSISSACVCFVAVRVHGLRSIAGPLTPQICATPKRFVNSAQLASLSVSVRLDSTSFQPSFLITITLRLSTETFHIVLNPMMTRSNSLKSSLP
jgi:hypothetical protein